MKCKHMRTTIIFPNKEFCNICGADLSFVSSEKIGAYRYKPKIRKVS